MLSKYWAKILKSNEYVEDVASDTIAYITQNRGDFFINFSEDVAVKKIKKFIKKHIEHKYKIYFNKRHKQIMDKKLSETSREERRKMTDKHADTEKEAMENISKVNEKKLYQVDDIYTQCIQLLQYYYEQGFSNTEAINKVAEDINLDKKTMLELLKKALIEKNKIRETSKGEYYLE